MAAPPVVVERFRVEHAGAGFTMSVVSLVDRRAAGNRIVRFVYWSAPLEAVLYGRMELGGLFWAHLEAHESDWYVQFNPFHQQAVCHGWHHHGH